MILIFGSHGYMGSAIVRECERRGVPWIRGRRGTLSDVCEQLVDGKCSLIINAAAFIPSPTVDACKDHPNETIYGNVIWPYSLVQACYLHDRQLMHLSTGCLFDEQREYSETDSPTRGWGGYCGFYVGTKLLAERMVSDYWRHYILRLRLPFDEVDHPRNYLTKLTKFEKVFDHVNSLTHRGDFAKWALDLWEKRAPYGTYHCVNKGQVSARQVVMGMMSRGLIGKCPEIVENSGTTGARLATGKLESAGVAVRSVEDAVTEALDNWRKADV